MLVPLFLMFRNRPANRFEPEPNAELLVPGQVPRELNKASVLAACRFALGIDKKEVWKGRALIGARRFLATPRRQLRLLTRCGHIRHSDDKDVGFRPDGASA